MARAEQKKNYQLVLQLCLDESIRKKWYKTTRGFCSCIEEPNTVFKSKSRILTVGGRVSRKAVNHLKHLPLDQENAFIFMTIASSFNIYKRFSCVTMS